MSFTTCWEEEEEEEQGIIDGWGTRP